MSRPAPATAGLRIGIDATCVASGRGYGRFLRELLPPLLGASTADRFCLFADAAAAARLPALPVVTANEADGADEADTAAAAGSVRVVRVETQQAQARAASATGRRRLADMWRMGRAVARQALDVMYFPSVYSYYPVPGRTPVAVAFHDAIPEHFAAIVFPHWRNRLFWNAKSRLARRRAQGLITVSEWSRSTLAACFGVAPEAFFVTPEAASPAFRPAPDSEVARHWLAEQGLSPQARYFVYTGGFNPHKNLPALVRAFAAVARSRRDLSLLLVGDHAGDVFHADLAALHACIKQHDLAARVHLPGFVDDETLRHLYSHALALVLPSLEEGFGLPAVEAAACGTGCVATRCSPLPQLLADAGLFFDPRDGAALESALARCADDGDLRAAHGAAALLRAGALSWQQTARTTRSALASIARRGRASGP